MPRMGTVLMCKPYSFQFIRDRILHGLAQATSHGPSLSSHSVGLSGEAVGPNPCIMYPPDVVLDYLHPA